MPNFGTWVLFGLIVITPFSADFTGKYHIYFTSFPVKGHALSFMYLNLHWYLLHDISFQFLFFFISGSHLITFLVKKAVLPPASQGWGKVLFSGYPIPVPGREGTPSQVSSVEVRVLCQGGAGGSKSSLIGQKCKIVDWKQPSDWTRIQDGEWKSSHLIRQ